LKATSVIALLALALLVLATVLFIAGLRRALQGQGAAWRLRVRQRPLRLVVTARSAHGANVRLVLARPRIWRWRPLPALEAGRYVALEMPLPEGRPARRCYSLAAWQRRPRSYELAIRREPGGRVSNWAATALQPGRRLRASAPTGRFVRPQQIAGETVLVAGGIGITPMRAMLHAWVAGARGHPLTLLWSVRERDDLLGYHEEFEDLARVLPGFRYVAVRTGADPQWHGQTGRITASRLLGWCQTREPLGVWMCAGAAMMDSLRAGLRASGFSAERIHQENFGAAANGDSQAYTVTVLPSGRQLPFQGEPSLLAMLQSAGVPLPSDCRNGSCGACRVQLLAGQVRQVIAPEWPLAGNELLACCCVPASDLGLVTTRGGT
jgi:ferredoxin-NADP reductase